MCFQVKLLEQHDPNNAKIWKHVRDTPPLALLRVILSRVTLSRMDLEFIIVFPIAFLEWCIRMC